MPWARRALISYLASERFDNTRRVIDWLEHGAARLPCRWPWIAAAIGRAGLAETGGNTQAADNHYQQALDLHRQLELPVEHIETLLGYGMFLRRHGQRLRARSHLAQALEIVEKCQATGWPTGPASNSRSPAAAETAPTKDPNPADRTGTTGGPAGQSNKAIAGQLFLSTKTIEYHHRSWNARDQVTPPQPQGKGSGGM